MKNEILGYGYISDTDPRLRETNIKNSQVPNTLNVNDEWYTKITNQNISSADDNWVIKEDLPAISNKDKEIQLYNEELTFEENFDDGSLVKYILLPIAKNNTNEEHDYSKLVNAGAKIIMNRKNVMDQFSEELHYLVLDYDSIFGLRLLSFQKYDNDFFTCEERVFFETLLIKFHSFKFKPFHYSFESIKNELGIKKDKAKSIVNKLVHLRLITSVIRKSFIDGRPSQITFYNVNANQVINLIPEIYKKGHHELAFEQLTQYLKPAIKNDDNGFDKRTMLQ